jgi:hypothetical protein
MSGGLPRRLTLRVRRERGHVVVQAQAEGPTFTAEAEAPTLPQALAQLAQAVTAAMAGGAQ